MNRTDIVKELQDLYPKLKKVEVQNVVYNLFGQLVWQDKWQKRMDKIIQTIDLKSVTTGTYLLKMECNQKMEYFKFLVE